MCFKGWPYARTPQDMDGTLTLIFAKSKAIWNILMKISALLQLRSISILTKFQGHSSKIGSAMPVWSFRRFWKLFLYIVGKELEEQNGQIRITQKWLEISTPNFHQLLTSMETRFVQKIKVIGAQNLNFPPKTYKTSKGRGGPNFWATPLKFGENWYWSKL